MTLKNRVDKLESQTPVDEAIEVLGVKMKMSDLKRIMKSAEGTALRPKPEPSGYTQ